MPSHPRDMIVSAEQRFPVRIRIGVPPGGLGQRYAQIRQPRRHERVCSYARRLAERCAQPPPSKKLWTISERAI